MKIKDLFPAGSAVSVTYISLFVITTIISIGVISIFGYYPTAPGSSDMVVRDATPSPTPIPKKPKRNSIGDVNGDPENVPQSVNRPNGTGNFKPNSPESNGSLIVKRSNRVRTENVDNNESVRSTTSPDAAKAQNGSGTGNADGSSNVVNGSPARYSHGPNKSYEMSKSDQIRARSAGSAAPGPRPTNGTSSNIASASAGNGSSSGETTSVSTAGNRKLHRTSHRPALRKTTENARGNRRRH